MTLSGALQRVFELNPELATLELEIQAALARMLQAGARPNPELSAEIQNLPAIGSNDLFRTTEATVLVSQRLETGGKRGLRVGAVRGEKDIAGRNLELARAELEARTRQAFFEVLANQQRLVNSREMKRLASQSHSVVLDRVAAGKASPVEQTRSIVALAAAQLEEAKQETELAASKDRLAALWGGDSRDIGLAEGVFQIPPMSPASGICIASSPDLSLSDAVVESRHAELALEQAMKKPDLTLTAGYRRSNPEMYHAWIAGISIPLPFFDKRRGAIAEARIRLEKASAEKRSVERHLRASLAQARHDYEKAALESTSLLKSALPAAAEVLTATAEGYRLGKFEYLSVIDAQRTHAELQRQYIEAIASGLKAAIEIERFAGCGSYNDRRKEYYGEK
jgi:cobalt-zinc-cadmium efflux system outer membrane protein